MEGQEFITNNEKLGFREIVLEHLRKILGLSLSIHNPELSIEYTKTYRDSVLVLADILLPFYDKIMNNYYEQYSKDYKEVISKTTKDNLITNNSYYNADVKELHRQLFRQLNLLLKRVDYLKQTIYEETEEH